MRPWVRKQQSAITRRRAVRNRKYAIFFFSPTFIITSTLEPTFLDIFKAHQTTGGRKHRRVVVVAPSTIHIPLVLDVAPVIVIVVVAAAVVVVVDVATSLTVTTTLIVTSIIITIIVASTITIMMMMASSALTISSGAAALAFEPKTRDEEET